jgi:hypothetical protein
MPCLSRLAKIQGSVRVSQQIRLPVKLAEHLRTQYTGLAEHDSWLWEGWTNDSFKTSPAPSPSTSLRTPSRYLVAAKGAYPDRSYNCTVKCVVYRVPRRGSCRVTHHAARVGPMHPMHPIDHSRSTWSEYCSQHHVEQLRC